MSASIVAAVGPVSAVETLVVTGAITPSAGSAYKVTLVGTVLSNVQVPVTFNLRMGTTGTIADALVASVSPVVNDFNGAQAFECSFISTARTTTVFDAFSNVQGNGNGSVIGITEVNPAPVTLGGVPSALTVSAVGAVEIVDGALMTNGSPWINLVTSNGVFSLGPITGGTLYTTGVYPSVALTGGNGTGATANITVAGGAVTSVVLVNAGTGYFAGDQLSALAANIGGTGSGFAVNVDELVGGAWDVGNVGIGNPVAFATTVGTSGGQVLAGTTYFIVASNVGTAGPPSQIQVSATLGGTPITFNAAGTTHVTLAYDCFVTVNQAVIQLM